MTHELSSILDLIEECLQQEDFEKGIELCKLGLKRSSVNERYFSDLFLHHIALFYFGVNSLSELSENESFFISDMLYV